MNFYILLCLILAMPYVIEGTKREGEEKVALNDFRKSLREFSGDLLYYISVTKQPSQNVFFSPTSISHLIGTVLAGANGTTETQIMRALKINPDMNYTDTNINKLFMKVYRKLFNASKGYDSAQMESGLFLQMGYPVYPAYTKILEQFYATGVQNVNFQDAPTAVQKINDWVSERTGGLIDDLLSEDSIEPMTRMALVNALYFKDSWAVKMTEHKNKDTKFITSTGRKRTPFMEGILPIKIGPRGKMYEIAIPYKNEEAYFVIIMPRSKPVMKAFMQRMTLANYFKNFKTKFDSWSDIKNRKFVMPKFQMEESLDMVQILKNMGIRDLFSEGKSNLTGIAEEQLHVSSFIHKAKLTVDEEGTEAAAASAGMVAGRSTVSNDIVINRSFVFGIYRHDSLLFLGKMVDPTFSK